MTCTGGDFSGSVNVIQARRRPDRVATSRSRSSPRTRPQTAVNIGTVDPANLVPEGNEFDNDDVRARRSRRASTTPTCTREERGLRADDRQDDRPSRRATRSPQRDHHVRPRGPNLGTDPISGVTVTDRLPAGFRFLHARDTSPPSDPQDSAARAPDASGGVTCVGASSPVHSNTLGGAPMTRHIQIRVFAPDVPGDVHQPRGRRSDEHDPRRATSSTMRLGGHDRHERRHGPFIDLRSPRPR